MKYKASSLQDKGSKTVDSSVEISEYSGKKTIATK